MTFRANIIESGNKNAIALTIIEDLLRTNGASRNGHNQKPKHGYMVSKRGGRVLHLTPSQTNIAYIATQIQVWVKTTKLPDSYNSYYGVWFDQETRTLYLDISTNFQEYSKAERFAEANSQLVIYDIDSELEIRL